MSRGVDRDPKPFLNALGELRITNHERAIALLWWHGVDDQAISLSAADLALQMEAAGYATQNVSRLRRSLERDRRTAKGKGGVFRIRIDARGALDANYLALVDRRPLPKSRSILPTDLFTGTRGYIEKVVAQINASFDFGLYDCCAVMCRRLLETLIIEAYEAQGRADELKDKDGHFKMFSGLLSIVESNASISLSRNAIQGLKDFKRLGDLSAHNRRFNAREDDIMRVRDGIRVASEELLQIAALCP